MKALRIDIQEASLKKASIKDFLTELNIKPHSWITDKGEIAYSKDQAFSSWLIRSPKEETRCFLLPHYLKGYFGILHNGEVRYTSIKGLVSSHIIPIDLDIQTERFIMFQLHYLYSKTLFKVNDHQTMTGKDLFDMLNDQDYVVTDKTTFVNMETNERFIYTHEATTIPRLPKWTKSALVYLKDKPETVKKVVDETISKQPNKLYNKTKFEWEVNTFVSRLPNGSVFTAPNGLTYTKDEVLGQTNPQFEPEVFFFFNVEHKTVLYFRKGVWRIQTKGIKDLTSIVEFYLKEYPATYTEIGFMGKKHRLSGNVDSHSLLKYYKETNLSRVDYFVYLNKSVPFALLLCSIEGESEWMFVDDQYHHLLNPFYKEKVWTIGSKESEMTQEEKNETNDTESIPAFVQMMKWVKDNFSFNEEDHVYLTSNEGNLLTPKEALQYISSKQLEGIDTFTLYSVEDPLRQATVTNGKLCLIKG